MFKKRNKVLQKRTNDDREDDDNKNKEDLQTISKPKTSFMKRHKVNSSINKQEQKLLHDHIESELNDLQYVKSRVDDSEQYDRKRDLHSDDEEDKLNHLSALERAKHQQQISKDILEGKLDAKVYRGE